MCFQLKIQCRGCETNEENMLKCVCMYIYIFVNVMLMFVYACAFHPAHCTVSYWVLAWQANNWLTCVCNVWVSNEAIALPVFFIWLKKCVFIWLQRHENNLWRPKKKICTNAKYASIYISTSAYCDAVFVCLRQYPQDCFHSDFSIQCTTSSLIFRSFA